MNSTRNRAGGRPESAQRYTRKPSVERAIRFIERNSALDAGACSKNFTKLARQFGFAKSVCGAWEGVGRNRKHRFFFADWPQSWQELYAREEFFQHDPVAIEARRRISAFWYSGIRHQFASEKQKQIYEAFVAFGWKDCFAVPIHGPGSLQGLVTLTTRDELYLSRADCAVLETAARSVWERCRISEGFGISASDRPNLTARELECLQWAAAGKTDTEIAALIGVRPATTHFHIERAKKRLGAKTRAEAVGLGLLHGLI